MSNPTREEMAVRIAADIRRKLKIEVTVEFVLSWLNAETPEECLRLELEYFNAARDAKYRVREARPYNPNRK